MASNCKSDRRLYLTQDKSRVVEQGDRDCAWLFATPGRDISRADAEAFGLEVLDGKIVLPGSEPTPPETPKAREKTEDKSFAKGEDKSAKKTEGKSTRK